MNATWKIATLLLGTIFLVPTASLAGDNDLSPRNIMEKSWWAGKVKGIEMLNELTIYDPHGQKRVRKTASIAKLYDGGETTKRLIRFLYPADVKGTGLLTYDYEKKDDDIWFFLPTMRKTRRIVSSEKSKNFMGSEFTYADITPPPVDDFTYKMLKQEDADDSKCWVIEITPKAKEIAEENGFSKKVAWVGQRDYTIRKAVYYDLQGKLLKEFSATDVTEVDTTDHRFLSLKMTMVNKQNGRKSTMEIKKHKLSKDIPDKYFSIRYLERI
jgi:outer membrane lipoprotein-sorting protein